MLDRVVLTAARIGMCARLRALASSRAQKVETVLTADRLVLLAGVKSALLACERARQTPRCDHRRGVHHISTASSLGEGWRRLFARPPILLCYVLQRCRAVFFCADGSKYLRELLFQLDYHTLSLSLGRLSLSQI